LNSQTQSDTEAFIDNKGILALKMCSKDKAINFVVVLAIVVSWVLFGYLLYKEVLEEEIDVDSFEKTTHDQFADGSITDTNV
jgi:hypothetical protein